MSLNSNLLIFIFQLLICYHFCQNECTTIYKINKLWLIDGICKIKEKNGNDNPKTYHVQICDYGYYCPKTENDIESCLFDYSLKIAGEKCNFNSECYSGDCDNKTYQCQPVEDNHQTCKTHYACGLNSYCFNGTCLPLIDEGKECQDEDSCKLGLGCNKKTQKCVKMFSLPNGENASRGYLCSSGVIDNNDICIDTYPKSSNEKCNTNKDCMITKMKKDSPKEEEEGNCVCDLEGNKYCELTSSSEEWKEYVSTFNKEISNIDINKVHQAGKRNFEKNNLQFDWGNDKIRTAYLNFDVKYKHVNKNIIKVVGKSSIQKYSFGLLVLLLYSIA